MGRLDRLAGAVRKRPVMGLLLGALVAAVLVVLVLRLGAGEARRADDGAGAGASVRVDAAAGDVAGGEDGAAGDAADGAAGDGAAGDAAPMAGGWAAYATTSVAELWYVDDQGVARAFADEPLTLGSPVSLNRGGVVMASNEVAAYGRDGASFRQLHDSYLTDLDNDLLAYRDGATEFASELALVVDPDQYEAFLAELATCDDGVRSRVLTRLVVASDLLEPEVEDAGSEDDGAADATSSATGGGADVDDEAGEALYGSKPSAGAME